MRVAHEYSDGPAAVWIVMVLLEQALASCSQFPYSVRQQKMYALFFAFFSGVQIPYFLRAHKNVDFAALFSPTHMNHILD